MKSLFVLFFPVVLSLAGCSGSQSQAQSQTYVLLNETEFAEKMKEYPEGYVIDVRTPGEYSGGHLQHAINIDWNNDNFNAEIAKLDKSKPVFVYCQSGGRSSKATAKLRADGFTTVYELKGGIMSWRAAGLPESGNEETDTGMNRQQFDALLNSEKLVLVDFQAPWCVPCQKMQPYLDEISKEKANELNLIEIDVDANQALTEELQIANIPVLNLYRNGELIWTHTGLIEEEALREVLDKYLNQ